MPNHLHLSESDAASEYLLASYHFQLLQETNSKQIADIFRLVFEVVSSEDATPPVGFLADLSCILLGQFTFNLNNRKELPFWPLSEMRAYEDYVLGKLLTDWTIERISDAIKQYEKEDQAKAIAFVFRQLWNRLNLNGVEISPAIPRGFLKETPSSLYERGLTYIQTQKNHATQTLILKQYSELIAAFRRSADLFATDDILAIEHRTAISEYGQYIAHRQIVQTAELIKQLLPTQAVRPRSGRQQVATKIKDDDIYPVGGYSSIGTKGSIESMLHSQLALMEGQDQQPDFFTLKFVRDELFYYTRDENQFLRRRRAFVFVIDESIEQSRIKDSSADVQRIVYLLATLTTIVDKINEWMATDSLRVEILFVCENESLKQDDLKLAYEKELLEIIFREAIERSFLSVESVTYANLRTQVDKISLQNETHLLWLSNEAKNSLSLLANEMISNLEKTDAILISRLQLNNGIPTLTSGKDIVFTGETSDDEASKDSKTDTLLNGQAKESTWAVVAEAVLKEWI